jgi:hypothetical protein
MKELITAGVIVGTLFTAAHVQTSHAEVIRDHPVVHGVIAKATGRACKTEDSINCFRSAGKDGNGTGHSFYSVRVGSQDCIVYWNEQYNKQHGHCLPHNS